MLTEEKYTGNTVKARKQDKKEKTEDYGTISDEEFRELMENILRKDKKLLEKLAKI